MVKHFLLLFLLFIFSQNGNTTQLPRQLNELDRFTTLKTLGFGTATKLNTDPNPLGGYQGFEFFLSTDLISIENIQLLGNRSGSGNQFVTTNLGFGKGIFFDIDTFIYFSPLQAQSKSSQIGGYVRKVVYANEDKPLQLSLNLHALS